ncbi:hypothetical protein B9Z19DRAFT_1063644 [Tuber borchii]|uniref:UspA domain-containing protein n=1 Tax=Tuber borchii TaxID=42251 RepID=A0A2T6ZXL4_TUBBO|nr:hypothetical protein B9Z19DRAFT_1063644 [Tuber borchii]
MTLPYPLRIMAVSSLQGGGRFHQYQMPHYITCHMQRSASPQSSEWLASPPPVARNQISNQISNDADVPLDLGHAYSKPSDGALAGSEGVLRMLPERRPITTLEGACPGWHRGVIDERRGGVNERAVIDSSDEDGTSSVEASVGSNSPVGEEEERRGSAAALRNGSGPSSKSSTARTEGTVEKGAGLWAIPLGAEYVEDKYKFTDCCGGRTTILRGEYESIVKEVEEGSKPVQKYLVATGLSGEAQHALEWTIGTVLGAGDTLMAIYVIDQDTVEDGGKIFPDDKIGGELSS